MVYFLLLLSIFLSPVQGQQTRMADTDPPITEKTLVVDGTTRTYVVFQPEQTAGETMPVVFGFHGSGGNGRNFLLKSGWMDLARKEGILLVFPSAMRYCTEEENEVRPNRSKWNDGKLASYLCEGQTPANDVAFFRELVHQVSLDYPVDKHAIYATGFSNGAAFVGRLTQECPDLLAATASVAGGMNAGIMPGQGVTSAMLVMGGDDPGIASKFEGPIPQGEAIVQHSVIADMMGRYTDALGLSPTYSFKETRHAWTFRYDQSILGEANEFRFQVIRKMKHLYPNGQNHPLVISEPIWSFFNTHRKKAQP